MIFVNHNDAEEGSEGDHGLAVGVIGNTMIGRIVEQDAFSVKGGIFV